MTWMDAVLGACSALWRGVKSLRARFAAAEAPRGQQIVEGMREDVAELERLRERLVKPDEP